MVRADDDDRLLLGDLEHGIDEARRRDLRAAHALIPAACMTCGLRARCMHRCGSQNFETTGLPGQVSPALCRWERSVIAAADRVANALFAERNRHFVRRFYAVNAADLGDHRA